MEGIKIQKASIEDKVLINNFFETVLRHTFEVNGLSELKELLNDELMDKRLCLDQCYESKGLDRFFLIATIGDKIVSSIEYGLSNKLLNVCTNHELKDMLEVGTIFVHPDYQKRGIGSLMLRSIFEELLSKGIQRICFDSGYKTAQRIWTKKFGEPEYFLKDYWDKDSHHMVWVIDIEEAIKNGSV